MRKITDQYGCKAKRLTHRVHVVHGDYPAVKRAVTNVKAVWDTGADRTSLDIAIIERLGLERLPQEPALIETGNGITKSYAYAAVLDMDDEWEPFRHEVWSMPASGSVKMLIGMDIIARGRLTVDSTGGETVVTFELP